MTSSSNLACLIPQRALQREELSDRAVHISPSRCSGNPTQLIAEFFESWTINEGKAHFRPTVQ